MGGLEGSLLLNQSRVRTEGFGGGGGGTSGTVNFSIICEYFS